MSSALAHQVAQQQKRKHLFRRFRDAWINVQGNGVVTLRSEFTDLDRRINDSNFEVDGWGFRAFWHPAGLTESEAQIFFQECAAISAAQQQASHAEHHGDVTGAATSVTVDLAEAAVFVRRAFSCRRQQLHDILKRIRAKQLEPRQCAFSPERLQQQQQQQYDQQQHRPSRVLVFNYLTEKGGLSHSEAFLLMDGCSVPTSASSSLAHSIDGAYAQYGASAAATRDSDLDLDLLSACIFEYPLPDSVAFSLLLGKVVDSLCDSFRGAGPTGVTAIVHAAAKSVLHTAVDDVEAYLRMPKRAAMARGDDEEEEDAYDAYDDDEVRLNAEQFCTICSNIAAGMPRAECVLLHALLADEERAEAKAEREQQEEDDVYDDDDEYDYDADDNSAPLKQRRRSPPPHSTNQHQQQQHLVSLRKFVTAVAERIPTLSPSAFYITVGEVRTHMVSVGACFSRLFLALVEAVRSSGGEVLERSTTIHAFRAVGVSPVVVPDIVLEQLIARFRGASEGGFGAGCALQLGDPATVGSVLTFLRDFVEAIRGDAPSGRMMMCEKLFARLTSSKQPQQQQLTRDHQSDEQPLLRGSELLRCFAPDLVHGGGGTQQQRLQRTAARCFDDLTEYVKMLESITPIRGGSKQQRQQAAAAAAFNEDEASGAVGARAMLSLADFLFFFGNFSASCVPDDAEFTMILWEGFQMHKTLDASLIRGGAAATPRGQRATSARFHDPQQANRQQQQASPAGIAAVIAASHEEARKRQQAIHNLQEPQTVTVPLSARLQQQQPETPQRRRLMIEKLQEQHENPPHRRQQLQQAQPQQRPPVPRYHHHYHQPHAHEEEQKQQQHHHQPQQQQQHVFDEARTPRRRMHHEILARQQQEDNIQQHQQPQQRKAPEAAVAPRAPVEDSDHFHVLIGGGGEDHHHNHAQQQQQHHQPQQRIAPLREGEIVGYTEDGRKIIAHVVADDDDDEYYCDDDGEPPVVQHHLHHFIDQHEAQQKQQQHSKTNKNNRSPPRPELADAVPLLPIGTQEQENSNNNSFVAGNAQRHQQLRNQAQRQQARAAATTDLLNHAQQPQKQQHEEEQLLEAPDHPLLHKKRLRRPTALEAYLASESKLARDINAFHHRPASRIDDAPAPIARRSPLRSRAPHELPPPDHPQPPYVWEHNNNIVRRKKASRARSTSPQAQNPAGGLFQGFLPSFGVAGLQWNGQKKPRSVPDYKRAKSSSSPSASRERHQ